jgi:hypothetical protein
MDIKTPNQPTGGSAKHHAGAPAYQNVRRTRRPVMIVIAAGLILAIAALVFALLWNAKSMQSGVSAVDTNKYQAVFLTNGQVYFGKASNLKSDYVTLKNIYYLQVQQSVQPSTDKPATATTDQNAGSQVSLTKLGQELHGPTDEMHIAKEQVLFWENLKDDSTVVKAIKDYETKK